MTLLQDEEYLVYLLRTSYLSNNKDGNGERLISIDPGAVYNDPILRGAGLVSVGDIKRTYSPPIPTTAAISSDYFSAPIRSAGFALHDFGDEDEEGGMVTGKGSNDTVGPGPTTKRRRRREQHEEDDSSDLSDESEDETEGNQRAAQQIKFAKMPVRTRAGSSPIRGSSIKDGPEVLNTTSAKRPEGGVRRGSLGAVEAVKQRARRDTTTSSEMSSENELDPSLFKRRQIGAQKSGRSNSFLQEQHEEDEADEQEKLDDVTENEDEDSGQESDGTSLSSEFAETADSGSLLDDVDAQSGSYLPDLPSGMSPNPPSPRKVRATPSNVLQELPPPRPISMIQPVSVLGQAIRARKTKPKNPVETFARFSGKGALDPLSIRIYTPFSESPSKPFEMPLQKTVQDTDSGFAANVKVVDAIGLCLWRYHEENIKPLIPREKLDANWWTLRIVDDGEVEYDFPALNRNSSIVDFTSNNNRPARGRGRGKSYDEFALVEATDAQYRENQRMTPKYTKIFEQFADEPSETSQFDANPTIDSAIVDDLPLNTTINKPFAFATRKQSATPADRPSIPMVHSTPRMGPPKMLKIHFTSLEAHTQTNTIEVTSDTYIAEVLDLVCKRWNLDKAHHFLRVSGTNTVAPLDRTVEAIGTRTDLDLVRRRFAHDGSLGLAASPSSSSPNAPLLLSTDTPKKGKKGFLAAHPLSVKQDVWGNTGNYKKYTVIRKQPMSFTPSHQRTLLMDSDYMHILPSETAKTLFDTNTKSTTVPFSMIVGCKVSRRHPKTFRVIIFKERETKRYDFEAQNVDEAAEIVREIRRGMEPFIRQIGGM